MELNSFDKRLRWAMDAQGLKQADLIRLAGEKGVKLGKSQISQYVGGKTTPRKEVLAILAGILSVEPLWLQSGEESVANQGLSGGATASSSQEALGSSKNEPLSSSKQSSTNREPAIAPAFRSSITSTPLSPVAPAVPFPEQERDPLMTPLPPITKSSKLDNVLYDVRGPVARRGRRAWRQAGTQILKLNIGNPAPFGFRTPRRGYATTCRSQLTECEGYSDSKGLFSARKAIMQYAQIKGIAPCNQIDDVYTGNGV